jgi:flagellar hook-length control protein FliK
LDQNNAFGVSPSQDSSLLSSAQLNATDTANSGGANAENGAGDSSASNAQESNASTPVNMAETYEKLSDQLTAELSKRMHEQISQGQWKMKFALKPSTLGAVDVQLEMKDGKLAAVFQADNALTQNLLQHSSQQLKDNLKDLGLEQTYVQVDQQNAGQSQQNDQQNNAKNPFDPLNEAQSTVVAQDSTPVVDPSMKVKIMTHCLI